MQVILNAGDEVLLPAPYWTTYPEPIALAGATTTVLPTTEETGFRVTVDQLNASLTERTKALIFVSPSNPTGAVYPKEEIEAIGQWALENNVWIFADEIYEHLVYGSNVHYSLPSLVPECADQTVILNGVAKTYAMTGWRWLDCRSRRCSKSIINPSIAPNIKRCKCFTTGSLSSCLWHIRCGR